MLGQPRVPQCPHGWHRPAWHPWHELRAKPTQTPNVQHPGMVPGGALGHLRVTQGSPKATFWVTQGHSLRGLDQGHGAQAQHRRPPGAGDLFDGRDLQQVEPFNQVKTCRTEQGT